MARDLLGGTIKEMMEAEMDGKRQTIRLVSSAHL